MLGFHLEMWSDLCLKRWIVAEWKIDWTGWESTDRKPYVVVQGKSNVSLPEGNGNGNEEKETNVKSFQKQSKYDLVSN